jgi:hypothetical protein
MGELGLIGRLDVYRDQERAITFMGRAPRLPKVGFCK